MAYTYSSGKNRLASIAATGDIISSTYQYDAIGNLARDVAENVFIEWNLAGKMKHMRKYAIDIIFSYSPLGQRQSKQVLVPSGRTKEWYIHDATGNIMCIYDSLSSNSIICKERPLYGSSRLGIDNKEITIKSGNWGPLPYTNRFRGYCGYRNFELSNHLGNVLTTFSDRKWGMDDNSDGIVDYYNPVVTSYTDYYPFGYPMPDRIWNGTNYRFGFNGQEKDNEIYGEGKSYTAEFWQYDSRLGRRWNLDPKGEASVSPYACFGNNPIMFSDILGDTVRNGYKYLIDRTEKLITQTGNAKNYYETQYGLSEDMSKKEYIAGGGKRKTWTEYRKTLSSLHGYQKNLAYYNERFEVTQKIIERWAKESPYMFEAVNSLTTDFILFAKETNYMKALSIFGKNILYHDDSQFNSEGTGKRNAIDVYISDKVRISSPDPEAGGGQYALNHEGGHFLYMALFTDEYIKYLNTTNNSDFHGGHGRYDESGKVANKYGKLKGNKSLPPISKSGN